MYDMSVTELVSQLLMSTLKLFSFLNNLDISVTPVVHEVARELLLLLAKLFTESVWRNPPW